MIEEKRSVGRPKLSHENQKELDKTTDQIDSNINSIKDIDVLSKAPVEEREPQTKLSQREIEKSKDLYLKPTKVISCREKFNEKFREDYNFAKEYVHFIAENHELIGESIEMWTKAFAGVPAEFWTIPVNKPLWAPRYVAEQLKRKSYHRIKMEQKSITAEDGFGQYYGGITSESTIQRLDARPVSSRKSVFLGASGF